MDKGYEIELMLVWGRDTLRLLESGAESLRFHPDSLKRYFIIANEALELLKQREEAAIQRGGGRPKGTGMGGQAAALIAIGVSEEDAVRMIADHHGKSADKVREALQRHRARQS